MNIKTLILAVNAFAFTAPFSIGNTVETLSSPIDLHVIWAPDKSSKTEFLQFTDFVLKRIPDESRVRVINGKTTVTEADFKIPIQRFESWENRLDYLRPELAKIKAFYNSAPSSNSVKLPECFSKISNDLKSAFSVVLVIGNPIYDHIEEVFSFTTQVPSTEVFELPAIQHPFGLKGRREIPNLKVLWAFPEKTFLDSRMQTRLERLYSEYCKGLGGVLFSFNPDLSELLDKSLEPLSQSKVISDPSDDIEHQGSFELPNTEAQLIRSEFKAATEEHDTAFGIAWSESDGADLDLWAFEQDDVAVSYRHKRSGDGRHLIDKLSGDGSWESIVYNGSLPSSVWVNCHSRSNKNGQPIKGIYFYRAEGRLKEGTFELPASIDGDGGKEGNRHSDENWVQLNISL